MYIYYRLSLCYRLVCFNGNSLNCLVFKFIVGCISNCSIFQVVYAFLLHTLLDTLPIDNSSQTIVAAGVNCTLSVAQSTVKIYDSTCSTSKDRRPHLMPFLHPTPPLQKRKQAESLSKQQKFARIIPTARMTDHTSYAIQQLDSIKCFMRLFAEMQRAAFLIYRAEPSRQGGRRSTLLWRLKVCSELRKGKREIVAVRFGFGFLMKGIYQHSCGQNIAAYFMFASGHSLLLCSPLPHALSTDFYAVPFFLYFFLPRFVSVKGSNSLKC